MSVEVKTFCPLGAKCEEAKDGAIHRCAWFAKVRGVNVNTGEEVDEWGCSMNWMPMLMVENSKHQRDTGHEINVFRNEMVKANQSSQQILLAAAQSNLIEIQ
jgi:hypothetical protein